MLPIVLNSEMLAIGLAGAGEGLERRHALLAAAGVTPRLVATDAPRWAALQSFSLPGCREDEAEPLAARARAGGILVNVEDMPGLCDFHVPAVDPPRRSSCHRVHRGQGAGPGPRPARMAGRAFGPEWAGRLGEVEGERAGWRAAGQPMAEVSRRTRAYVTERGWLS